MTDARRLVDKLWSYCDVLRDDGVGVIEYTEQLTYRFPAGHNGEGRAYGVRCRCGTGGSDDGG